MRETQASSCSAGAPAPRQSLISSLIWAEVETCAQMQPEGRAPRDGIGGDCVSRGKFGFPCTVPWGLLGGLGTAFPAKCHLPAHGPPLGLALFLLPCAGGWVSNAVCSSEARLKRAALSGFGSVMDPRKGLQFPFSSLSFFSEVSSCIGNRRGVWISHFSLLPPPFLSFFFFFPLSASHLGTLSIQNSSNQSIKTLGISTRVNANVPTLISAHAKEETKPSSCWMQNLTVRTQAGSERLSPNPN